MPLCEGEGSSAAKDPGDEPTCAFQAFAIGRDRL